MVYVGYLSLSGYNHCVLHNFLGMFGLGFPVVVYFWRMFSCGLEDCVIGDTQFTSMQVSWVLGRSSSISKLRVLPCVHQPLMIGEKGVMPLSYEAAFYSCKIKP